MHNPGRAFRELLRTEPYLFTGGVYSPLDAQIAERVGIKSIYLSGYSMALANGWPDMGFLTQTEVARIGAMVASAVEIPGHRRRRRRLRQRALDDPDGAGVRAQRRGRYPHRGPGLPQALRSHRGQDDHQRGSGRRKYRRGRRHAGPAEPGLRHHRPHRRLRRGGRQSRGGHPPRPGLRGRRRGPGVARALEPGPRAGRGVCQGHARVAPERAAGVQLLVIVQVAQGPEPFTFRELGELGYKFIFITLFAAHAGMYAVWNAMEELVQDQEQAQWRLEKTKDGHPTESHHVMARVSHFQELEKKYIPGSDERIKGSAGYDDKRMH